MTELSIAAAGWVATDPREVVGDGVPYTSFRLAHTPRRRNAAGEWVDGETVWFTVKAWRDAAFNIAASLRKRDPVLVQGRLRVETWQRGDDKGTTLVLEADAVGHDLMRGTTLFARRKNVHPGLAEDGQPTGRDVNPWPADAHGPTTAPDEPEGTVPFGPGDPTRLSGGTDDGTTDDGGAQDPAPTTVLTT